jgi:hypothetical protein
MQRLPGVLLALMVANVAIAADAVPTTVPLDAATLAALPRQPVAAKLHDVALQCEGVALRDLLRKAGAMSPEPLHGRDLARVVTVSARDGYRVVFSLAELDATLGDRGVFLVDRCNGKPLDDKDGPLRLLVPADTRPARGVRQIDSVRVDALP